MSNILQYQKAKKVGRTGADCQQDRCVQCRYKYTPQKNPRGYDIEIRQQPYGCM